jgi:hypothetical protein
MTGLCRKAPYFHGESLLAWLTRPLVDLNLVLDVGGAVVFKQLRSVFITHGLLHDWRLHMFCISPRIFPRSHDSHHDNVEYT